MPRTIPIHDFSADNEQSISFRYEPLDVKAEYDFTHPHRHNYYEIFFFANGGGTHIIDFDEVPIETNSIHFVSPGQIHLVKRSPGSHGFLLLFSRDFFYMHSRDESSLFNFPFLNNGRAPVLTVTQQEFEEFGEIMKQIRIEAKEKINPVPQILNSYLHIVLLKCLQLYREQYTGDAPAENNLFNRFRMLAEQQYRQRRQPSWFAGELAITEKKLNEICKEHTGISVSDYIKDRTMLEAKRLLSHSNHNIKEIGAFLGFEDPSYFNRFFKTNAGITAGDFRKDSRIVQ